MGKRPEPAMGKRHEFADGEGPELAKGKDISRTQSRTKQAELEPFDL